MTLRPLAGCWPLQSCLDLAGFFSFWPGRGPPGNCLAILLLFGPGPAQDQLESVLEVLHRQMEQYQDQPQHLEKIAYQQRLLQEDLVHIRAELCRESTVRRCSPGPTPALPRMGWEGAAFLVSQPVAEKVARGKSL